MKTGLENDWRKGAAWFVEKAEKNKRKVKKMGEYFGKKHEKNIRPMEKYGAKVKKI